MALGLLVFVHELGHFLVARWCRVRVLVFSLGFGPRVWGRSVEGTEYQLSLIPLGGYVKMLGESDAERAEVAVEERGVAFSFKPLWQRVAVVSAGPLANLLFAVVALWITFMLGVNELLPVIGKVTPEMPAARADLRIGDRVVAIDGRDVERWELLSSTIKSSGGNPVELTVERGGGQFAVTLTPEVKEIPNLFGEPTRTVLIGIGPDLEAVVMVDYSPLTALVKGVAQTWTITEVTVMGIWKMLTRVISLDQVGGPIMIAELAGKSAALGSSSFMYFIAVISVNLGIFNLLPIPILDGGHLLFYLIEAVKGRPVSDQARAVAFQFGITLLAGLMILAFYNDLLRVFSPG